MIAKNGPNRGRSGSERRASVQTGIVEAKRQSTNNNINSAPSAPDEIKEMTKDEAKRVMATADF
jgi:hypothetical protein